MPKRQMCISMCSVVLAIHMCSQPYVCLLFMSCLAVTLGLRSISFDAALILCWQELLAIVSIPQAAAASDAAASF